MILLADTSSPLCKLTFISDGQRQNHEWQADRMLAKKMLSFLDDTLSSYNRKWSDITAIGVYEGPGSFTGLRIGLTVMNTLADAQGIPIVGGRGNDWQNEVLNKLQAGENSGIVLPYYANEAAITQK